jgi:hypothetical protein
MPKICLFSFMYLFVFNANARIGLADWSAETPRGHTIDNFTVKTLYLKNKQEVKWVKEWYFYKDHIIGKTGDKNFQGEILSYFVVHELRFTVKTFQDEASWQSYIEINDLKPKLWTRWYKGDWSVGFGALVMAFMFGITFSIHHLFGILFVGYTARTKEPTNQKKLIRIMFLILLGIIFLKYLLAIYPQSI